MPRFEYDRLTADDFQRRLTRLHMKAYAFARLFGVKSQTVKKWLRGENDIPAWVFTALALLELPGGFVAARDAAANMIRLDNNAPQLGEYPYLANSESLDVEGDGFDD